MRISKYIIPTLTGVVLSAGLTAANAAPQSMHIASLIKENGQTAVAASKLSYIAERTSPELYAFKRDRLQLQQHAITNQLLAGILIELKSLRIDNYHAMNHVVPMMKVQAASHVLSAGKADKTDYSHVTK